MPARPQWLTHTPEIVAELEALDAPVIDRAVLERTFGVRRRRAAQLMRAFGGYQTGRTYLVERLRLIAQLREIASSGAFAFEFRRRERLTEALETARQHRQTAAITIPAPSAAATPEQLPPGVQLSPGVLKIEFDRPVDLLEKLFQLAQTITANFEWFEASAKR
jgi:hypothetical protein